jgi:hypothetical protein
MQLLGIESSAGLVRYAVESGMVGQLARPGFHPPGTLSAAPARPSGGAT